MKTLKALSIALVLSVCFYFQTAAEPVDVNIAKKVAINVYSERCHSAIATPEISETIIKSEKSVTVFYIFNFEKPQKGFVIVSADDLSFPVLGYSFEGLFDPDDTPPQLDFILSEYTGQILAVNNSNIAQDISVKDEWSRLSAEPGKFKGTNSWNKVGPLLSTRWNQNWPYNELCPADGGGPGGHAYAGCVATAMAQVMKYWSNPEHGTGSHGYNHYNYGYLFADFAATTYDWNNMPASISESNTAVATLLYHCGVSVEMNYGPSGSGANLDGSHGAMNALIDYFNYDMDAYYAEKYQYEDSVWQIMLRNELESGRPLIYGGWGDYSGHSWDLDGYEKVGDLYHYHMNWGWGGSYNGYYYLDDLTPGSHDYYTGQEAIFNLHPYASNLISCFPQNSNYWTGTTNSTTKTETSLVFGTEPEDGWMSFDISGIPDGAHIYAVSFNGYVYERNKPNWSITPVTGDPVIMNAADLHTDIVAEQSSGYYFTKDETNVNYGIEWRTYMLAGDVCTDMQSALPSDKFSIGIANKDLNIYHYIHFHGWNEANPPFLNIYYAAFGNLEGYVTEYGSSNPVEGIYVTIGHFTDTTDSNGYFLIEDIPIGTYDVTFDVAGKTNSNGNPYFNDTLPATISCGVTTQLDCGLQWAEIDLSPASVSVMIDPYETITENFTITNNGPGDLNYTCHVEPPMGDILADYDIEANSGEAINIYGCEFDGEHIWATGAAVSYGDHQLYKLDKNGNLISQYSQGTTSAFGMAKMTFDGTYLYSYDGYGFYRIDPADGSVTTLFTDYPEGLYQPIGIAWVPDLGFVTYKGSEDFFVFDETGTLVTRLENNTTINISDMTYDSINDCLWLAGSPNYTIYQYDLQSESLTGLSWLLPNLEGAIYQSANGICMSDSFIENTLTLCGVTLANPTNRFFALEIESWLKITANRVGTVEGSAKESSNVSIELKAGELTVASKSANIVIINNAGDDVTLPVTITNNYTHGSISGYITEFGNSNPIANATVTINGLSAISNGTGYYNIENIPIGTYDMTISHSDYVNDTIRNYPVTGLPDQKEIELKWTDISVNPGIYNVTLQPGNTMNTDMSISNSGTADLEYSCDVSFPQSKSSLTILVVDKDLSEFDYFGTGGEEYPFDEWWAYQSMLDNNGLNYTYYKVSYPWYDGPDLTTMQNYDLIIWFTGEIDGYDALTENDESNLGAYLDSGGSLFFASYSYLNSYGGGGPTTFDPGTFAYDYLGIQNADLETWDIDFLGNMTGVAGSFAEGYSCDFHNMFTFNYLNPAMITNNTGDNLFNITDPFPQGICGIQLEAGNYKVVYTEISFSLFSDYTVRDNLFNDMISFFDSGSWLTITSNGSGILTGETKSTVNVGLKFDASGLTNGTYTADIIVTSNDPSSPTTVPVTLNVSDSPGAVLKVYLEGAFNGVSMDEKLCTLPEFPLTQPYSGNPWNYPGTESVSSIPANVVDWILVEFRDAADAGTATASTRISRQAAFLLSDGSVVGIDGYSYLQIGGTVSQNLFALIYHRNHLTIMSANPVTVVNGNYFYDFTTGSEKVYQGVAGYKEIAAGIWGMVAGNGVCDNEINNTDKTNCWMIEAGLSGYYYGDFDLNGNVDNKDKDEHWVDNIGKICSLPQ